MSSAPRFSFLKPSAGDKLLARATSCKIELLRWPTQLRELADDTLDDAAAAADGNGCWESGVEVRFTLTGDLPVSGLEAAELLAAIGREFMPPPSVNGKGGAQ